MYFCQVILKIKFMENKSCVSTVKLGTLVASEQALIRLNNATLPIDISWNLKKLMLKVSEELKTYEETRVKLVVEMGKEDPEGSKNYKVLPENMDSFLQQNNELLATDIELKIPSITVGELSKHKDSKGDSINLSVVDLIQLEWLIKD